MENCSWMIILFCLVDKNYNHIINSNYKIITDNKLKNILTRNLLAMEKVGKAKLLEKIHVYQFRCNKHCFNISTFST